MDRSVRNGLAVLWGLAATKLLIHFADNAWGGYGYFRDELYYLACSHHLAAGYVDQPPVSIFLLALNRLVLGDSIFALRFLPAIAGAAVVFLAGLIARELGGGKFAVFLAAAATLISPSYLSSDAYYSMNAYDDLFWTFTIYLLARLLTTQKPKYWIALGITLGFGLMNKIGVLWLGAGIFAGMLLTSERKWLKTKWPYLAGIISSVLFLPYIVWNLQHDMATLEFIRVATGEKYSTLSFFTFIKGLFLDHNPVSFPLWMSGLFFLFFTEAGRRFKLLGFVYLSAFLILVINGHSKSEYLDPCYTLLFAAGSVAIEQWSATRWTWIRPAYAAVLVITGIILIPAAFPALPVEDYIRYADAMGIAPSTAEHKELDKLPQSYADMFGWEEKAVAVAKVYHSLSPEEQRKCAIFADNYGRCAAIDFFGKRYGLPDAIGNHNNYWIWGPRGFTGEVMIILGGDLEHKQEVFEDVQIAGAARCDYCMPYENNLQIYVCRKLKLPVSELWPRVKHFD